MAEDLVAIATALIEAWNRDDWEFMASRYWPDAVAKAPAGWPEAEDAQGWPAIQRQFERLKEPWEQEESEVADVEAIGEDAVLIHVIWQTVGKGSGITVESQFWLAARFREGKVDRMEFFFDPALARSAAEAM